MDLSAYPAYLFDLDGVLTPTAEVHMVAWEQMFTGFLADYPDQLPYTSADYFAHVDGKPRHDGVQDFLHSRNIVLPDGDPVDPPSSLTVFGLGNRKNAVFNDIVLRDGVAPYPGSVALVLHLVEAGAKLAVVSSSRNAEAVLASAGLSRFFPVIVDGNVRAALGLPGKPAPDTFYHAAEALGVPSQRCVIVEDAISGVRAGASGDFGLVIGVDRGVGGDELRRAGADLVVGDLEELLEA